MPMMRSRWRPSPGRRGSDYPRDVSGPDAQLSAARVETAAGPIGALGVDADGRVEVAADGRSGDRLGPEVPEHWAATPSSEAARSSRMPAGRAAR